MEEEEKIFKDRPPPDDRLTSLAEEDEALMGCRPRDKSFRLPKMDDDDEDESSDERRQRDKKSKEKRRERRRSIERRSREDSFRLSENDEDDEDEGETPREHRRRRDKRFSDTDEDEKYQKDDDTDSDRPRKRPFRADRSLTPVCFICNLPILTHESGLVWTGGNGYDDAVREELERITFEERLGTGRGDSASRPARGTPPMGSQATPPELGRTGRRRRSSLAHFTEIFREWGGSSSRSSSRGSKQTHVGKRDTFADLAKNLPWGKSPPTELSAKKKRESSAEPSAKSTAGRMKETASSALSELRSDFARLWSSRKESTAEGSGDSQKKGTRKDGKGSKTVKDAAGPSRKSTEEAGRTSKGIPAAVTPPPTPQRQHTCLHHQRHAAEANTGPTTTSEAGTQISLGRDDDIGAWSSSPAMGSDARGAKDLETGAPRQTVAIGPVSRRQGSPTPGTPSLPIATVERQSRGESPIGRVSPTPTGTAKEDSAKQDRQTEGRSSSKKSPRLRRQETAIDDQMPPSVARREAQARLSPEHKAGSWITSRRDSLSPESAKKSRQEARTRLSPDRADTAKGRDTKGGAKQQSPSSIARALRGVGAIARRYTETSSPCSSRDTSPSKGMVVTQPPSAHVPGVRRQSTTEEIFMARGFRRQATAEEQMRYRNIQRETSRVEDPDRSKGRRDSCAQISDGTAASMTIEVSSTLFDAGTQTDLPEEYENNHYHEECLKCNTCGIKLSGPFMRRAKRFKNSIYCELHFGDVAIMDPSDFMQQLRSFKTQCLGSAAARRKSSTTMIFPLPPQACSGQDEFCSDYPHRIVPTPGYWIECTKKNIRPMLSLDVSEAESDSSSSSSHRGKRRRHKRPGSRRVMSPEQPEIPEEAEEEEEESTLSISRRETERESSTSRKETEDDTTETESFSIRKDKPKDGLESPARKFKPMDEPESPARIFKPKDGLESPARRDKPKDGLESPARKFKPMDEPESPAKIFKPKDGLESPTRIFKPKDGLESPARRDKPKDGLESPARKFKPMDEPESPAKIFKPKDGLESPARRDKPKDKPESPARKFRPKDGLESLARIFKPKSGLESPARRDKPKDKPESPARRDKPKDGPESPARKFKPMDEPEASTSKKVQPQEEPRSSPIKKEKPKDEPESPARRDKPKDGLESPARKFKPMDEPEASTSKKVQPQEEPRSSPIKKEKSKDEPRPPAIRRGLTKDQSGVVKRVDKAVGTDRPSRRKKERSEDSEEEGAAAARPRADTKKSVTPIEKRFEKYGQFDLISVEQDTYEKYFYGKEHWNYFTNDNDLGPVILSFKQENIHAREQFRILVRAVSYTAHGLIPVSCVFADRYNREEVVQSLGKEISLSPPLTLGQLPDVPEELLKLDQIFIKTEMKVGVIYVKEGQTTEQEILSNTTNSTLFETFLHILGNKIRLKGFDKYKGGLDTVNDLTGLYSIYTKWRNIEMMFHVSTLLPYEEQDPQKLQRKRHIGNDIVCVVFLEADNTSFSPSCIKSHFLHTFIVVRTSPKTGRKRRYEVSIVTRDEVGSYKPYLWEQHVFERGPLFREWLLTKIVNGERASFSAPKFSVMRERTRSQILDDIVSNLANHAQTGEIPKPYRRGSWRPLGHMRPTSPLKDSLTFRVEDPDTLARDFTRVFANTPENLAPERTLFDVMFLVGTGEQQTRLGGVRAILGVRSRVFQYMLYGIQTRFLTPQVHVAEIVDRVGLNAQSPQRPRTSHFLQVPNLESPRPRSVPSSPLVMRAFSKLKIWGKSTRKRQHLALPSAEDQQQSTSSLVVTGRGTKDKEKEPEKEKEKQKGKGKEREKEKQKEKEKEKEREKERRRGKGKDTGKGKDKDKDKRKDKGKEKERDNEQLSVPRLSVCADAQKVDPAKLRQKTFQITEFDELTFRGLLDYLHTGSVPLSCKRVPGLICAAEHYDLPDLLQACFHHVKQHLRIEFVCMMLNSLERYYWGYSSASELVNMIMAFVETRPLELFKLPAFLTLSETMVQMIMNRELDIPEILKFHTMLSWAKNKVQSLPPTLDQKVEFRGIMERLTRDLKLYRITPTDLIRYVLPSKAISNERILETLLFQANSKMYRVQDSYIDYCQKKVKKEETRTSRSRAPATPHREGLPSAGQVSEAGASEAGASAGPAGESDQLAARPTPEMVEERWFFSGRPSTSRAAEAWIEEIGPSTTEASEARTEGSQPSTSKASEPGPIQAGVEGSQPSTSRATQGLVEESQASTSTASESQLLPWPPSERGDSEVLI